jgi:PAS domain S-box-containing protein
LLPVVALSSFVYVAPEAGSLVAFDWALSTARAQLLPRLLEGAFGGLVVLLIFAGVPHWELAPRTLVPAPTSRSVRNRLLLSFIAFAVTFSFVLTAIVFSLSVNVATRLLVNQMGHNALSVTEQIPDFRNQVQNLLHQYGSDPVLLSSDKEEVTERLAQLTRTAGAYYRRVLVVDAAGNLTAFYPDRDVDSLSLTGLEEQAVSAALERGSPSITAAQNVPDGEHVLSFVVPILNADGEPEAALIGRIPNIALNRLIAGIQGTVGEGSGFIVDQQGQVIAHPDQASLLTPWESAPRRARRFRLQPSLPGFAYEGRESETNAREIVYVVEGPDHPWTVVITVPYQVVLRLALQISAPLTLALMIGMALFGLVLAYMGRSITNPLGRLLQASQQIAAGRWDVALPVREEDEVGQLGQAFERMRRSMQQQFHDLRLLLDVSQGMSTTMDIRQGMPAILRGALRGTGASGARAVVVNPSGRYPLLFHEGPAGREMAAFDRKVTALARGQKEIMLSTPAQVREVLELDDSDGLPVRSLVALPLYAQERFQGVLWLGHRRSHNFNATELSLLRTIASQASVLIDNARLFATAEGQRRRLAAVLSSTSDAVIVTDQTDRVLLVNRAMELAFDLQAADVVGRSVADVIDNQRLVEALTEREDRVRDLEIPAGIGRTFYAGVSTIVSNDGQVLGRVAVLHDITRLKELDEMKSDFVATVSHDLRSPLTYMRGYVTMLPMVGEVNEKQELYLEKILSGMEQMTTLVEDLLDLGRIEAGLELARDQLNPRLLLIDVCVELGDQASAQGIELKLDVAPDLPPVYGEPSMIRRAMVNLVGNAIKYAPNSDTVTLKVVADEDEVIFSIEDQGPGISQEDQMRLFEKFYRVYYKGQDAPKGSGLGLAIVKSIAERHGGRVWLRSALDQGSTFFFSLPIDDSPERPSNSP